MRQDGSEEQRGSVVDPLVIGRRRATFFRRACAMLIDFFVAGMLFLGGLILPLVLLERKGIIDLPDWDVTFSFYGNWYSLLWLVLYFALVTWMLGGRTPGKWLCGIRVVSLNGDRLSFKSSLKRALGFGLFQSIPGRGKTTRHDEKVGTMVVRDPIFKRKRKSIMVDENARGAIKDPASEI